METFAPSPIPNVDMTSNTPLYTNDERNAMRAYLQRCEVRLSTLHRVITAFVSGAALMVLIPVFFKDVVMNLIQILLNSVGNQFPHWGANGIVFTGILYISLAILIGLALTMPIRALYVLFKDIVDFYFLVEVPNAISTTDNIYNPTFALTGIAFSEDESPQVRRDILKYQYQRKSFHFVMPFSAPRRYQYFEPLLNVTGEHIIPPSRQIMTLQAQGVIPVDSSAAFIDEARHFGASMGIVRSYDRTLAEEVALQEMSLTRHILFLRRLVLRYVKTLLLFVWTLLVLFGAIAMVQSDVISQHHHSLTFLILALGGLIWSLPIRLLLHRPINWIYRPVQTDVTNELQVDPQLIRLESEFGIYQTLAVCFGLIAVALSVVSVVQHYLG